MSSRNSLFLRMPRNDQATALTVRRNEGPWGPAGECALMTWRPLRTAPRPTEPAGVTLPTSKKVYDSVIVVTSLDNFGSITNTTGHCFVSPGSSVCCLKQKHSSLLKWAAAWCGA